MCEREETLSLLYGVVNILILGDQYLTAGRNTAYSGVRRNGFKWVTTGQVMTYTNWRPSQPLRAASDNIYVVVKKQYNWGWDDDPPAAQPFVCEY
jgi:hypothetical protein